MSGGVGGRGDPSEWSEQGLRWSDRVEGEKEETPEDEGGGGGGAEEGRRGSLVGRGQTSNPCFTLVTRSEGWTTGPPAAFGPPLARWDCRGDVES